MSTDREDNQVVRDAHAAIAAAQDQQALDDGSMTFGEYAPGEADRILAELPSADELDVPTSIRLPVATHRRLRAYAEQHQTTASALIRDWVEQMLTTADRPISLADAVRVLSTLPSQGQQNAA